MCCPLNLEELKKAIKTIEPIEIKGTNSELYTLSWQYQAKSLVSLYKDVLKT
jgi:ABC-type lipoprotein release transport system permease subunit